MAIVFSTPLDVMSPGSSEIQRINIGTRKSKLALLQTEIVVKALKQAWPDYHFEIRSSDSAAGDVDKVTPFKEMPVKNLWTHDLEHSMLSGDLDLLVHSLKDVPTQIPPNCGLGAIMNREDPRDALVLKAGRPKCGLANLPAGSVVGTSSIRRTAQIARKHPHLQVRDVRGNVPTRLRKLDEDGSLDALILAAAGLVRLGLEYRVTELLSSSRGGMLYAVGQGAIGVECRQDDTRISQMLGKVNDRPTSLACLAERSLLRRLEGGCSAPLGVETQWLAGDQDPALQMMAVVVSLDGTENVEVTTEKRVTTDEEANSFGSEVADLLIARGAGQILDAIRAKKPTEVIDLQE